VLHVDAMPAAQEALVADEAMRRLERSNTLLAANGGAVLAQAARGAAQAQRDLLAINAGHQGPSAS
jgi:hypothetical protein